MTDLIERLRSVKWEVTDDCGRMPDDPTHKCVFVDMRPADFRALLREAAAALEAAREDAERYRWLRAEHTVNSPLANVCWKQNYERECGEWVNTASPESLDAAIDQARGKEGQEVGNG
jgi:hypothetical protein